MCPTATGGVANVQVNENHHFVLGSPVLAAQVTGAFIDRDERDPAQGTGSPSDHAPVVVDLDLS